MRKGWEFLWHYKEVGKYAAQVKAFMQEFKHVKVCYFDEFAEAPGRVTRQICAFLGVDETAMPDNVGKIYNSSGKPRSNALQRFLQEESAAKMLARRLLPSTVGRRVAAFAREKNLRKTAIAADSRRALAEYFAGDVRTLGHVLGADLSHWLTGPSSPHHRV